MYAEQNKAHITVLHCFVDDRDFIIILIYIYVEFSWMIAS